MSDILMPGASSGVDDNWRDGLALPRGESVTLWERRASNRPPC